MNFKSFIKNLPTKIEKTLYKTRGNYKIYFVDDSIMRDITKDLEEFSDYASYLNFPKIIPKNELWISKNYKEKELKYFIEEFFNQIKYMKNGIDEDEAYKLSLKKEKAEREKDLKITFKNNIDTSKLYIDKFADYDIEGITVFIVDGELVRDLYKTDYVEGGHGYVYNFIPKNEVWIEDSIKTYEIKYILLHELFERNLMKTENMDYNTAHEKAADIEFKARESNTDIINLKINL